MPCTPTVNTNGGAEGFSAVAPWKDSIEFEGAGRPLGEGDAGDLLEVVDEGDARATSGAARRCVCLLAVADLEGEQAVWFEGVVAWGMRRR